MLFCSSLGKVALHITAQIKQCYLICRKHARPWLAFIPLTGHSHRKHAFETNVSLHALTPMHVLKVIPTKHTLKLLFGLPSRKQVSPLNLTIVMATAKWVQGGLMRGSVACLVKWGCQSFSRWHEFKECGWTMDGESEGKGKGEDERRRKEKEEKEMEVKEESGGWKAPEV